MIAVEQPQFDSINNRKTYASIIKSLGHPVRLKILTTLDMREFNVKNIWECLGLKQCVVSQHLAVMKKLGIINGIRRGPEIFYTIVNPLVQRIIAVLNNEWKSL